MRLALVLYRKAVGGKRNRHAVVARFEIREPAVCDDRGRTESHAIRRIRLGAIVLAQERHFTAGIAFIPVLRNSAGTRRAAETHALELPRVRLARVQPQREKPRLPALDIDGKLLQLPGRKRKRDGRAVGELQRLLDLFAALVARAEPERLCLALGNGPVVQLVADRLPLEIFPPQFRHVGRLGGKAHFVETSLDPQPSAAASQRERAAKRNIHADGGIGAHHLAVDEPYSRSARRIVAERDKMPFAAENAPVPVVLDAGYGSHFSAEEKPCADERRT